MSRAVALLSVLALSGCYLSHELGDGGTPPLDAPHDAPRDVPRVDAFPGCPFAWDDVVTARIATTTDDAFTLYVNGTALGGSTDWHVVQHFTVTLHRHPSRENVIAVDAQNLWSIDGLDRGTVLDLRATLSGIERFWTSGEHFRFGPATPGWMNEGFDASSWTPIVDEGAHGIGPWGPVLGTSPARWMWTYDSDRFVGAKPNTESVRFRSSVYFAVDGEVSEEPLPCP